MSITVVRPTSSIVRPEYVVSSWANRRNLPRLIMGAAATAPNAPAAFFKKLRRDCFRAEIEPRLRLPDSASFGQQHPFSSAVPAADWSEVYHLRERENTQRASNRTGRIARKCTKGNPRRLRRCGAVSGWKALHPRNQVA